jgi:peptidyl-prolyl cis-trans isomerase SurA
MKLTLTHSLLYLLALLLPHIAHTAAPRTADYIVAVVNRESVTFGELQMRIEQAIDEAQRSGKRPPAQAELREPLLNTLIDERVQLTHAREVGQRIDDNELDRAVANVAAQNQLTVTQMRARLQEDGMDYQQFRANIRDQILLERVREREVRARITVSDTEVEAKLALQKSTAPSSAPEHNIAQIFIAIPAGASQSLVTTLQAKAQALLTEVRTGSAFDTVAKRDSEDLNQAQGGEIGMRTLDRLPDAFNQAVSKLQPGDIVPELVRTSAGFHVLKLLARKEPGSTITQTRVRHILLRPSSKSSAQVVANQLNMLKRKIANNPQAFEKAARDNSEDASAPQGGDLGWVLPGNLVPEFEQAMNALTINAVSEPITSRFGLHLIQVTARRDKTIAPKEQREQIKAALREEKSEAAAQEWVRELRALAYVEMREPPP